MLHFSSTDEAIYYGKKTDKFIMFYGDWVLNCKDFMDVHPGGKNWLINFKNKDIKQIFANPKYHFHQKLSINTLQGLVIGTLNQADPPQVWYNPNEAMVPQIYRMKHQDYLRNVDKPFHVGSPRMFQNSFLQFCSHNKWYHILIIHFFLQVLFFKNAWAQYNPTIIQTIIVFILGLPIWTLMQYLIHRFIFHSQWYIPDHPFIRVLHFILHGIHHMIPMDPDRLVFPPAMGIIVSLILSYLVIVPIIGQPWGWIFFAGGHIGYVCYDMIHYSVHHVKGKGAFQWLKKYHNSHHYRGLDQGYGVSNPFWDLVFRTFII